MSRPVLPYSRYPIPFSVTEEQPVGYPQAEVFRVAAGQPLVNVTSDANVNVSVTLLDGFDYHVYFTTEPPVFLSGSPAASLQGYWYQIRLTVQHNGELVTRWLDGGVIQDAVPAKLINAPHGGQYADLQLARVRVNPQYYNSIRENPAVSITGGIGKAGIKIVKGPANAFPPVPEGPAIETDGTIISETTDTIESVEKLIRADVKAIADGTGGYDMVWYDESDGLTELMRKSAKQPDGSDLASPSQIVGGLVKE